MTRLLVALHATAPAALVAAMLLHLWPPAGLPPLAQRPPWATWAFLGTWLLSAVLAARWVDGARLWRLALAAAAALLLLAGAAGLGLGAPLAPAMAWALALLGAGCAALAACIGPARVLAAPRRPVPARAAPARTWRQRLAAQAGHAPFWLAGALAVESFRLAHVVATGDARPSGMLGLLLACLVALPAATLRTWMPRTSGALWAVAALAYAGLAARSGVLAWTVAALLCLCAALHGVLRRPPARSTP